MKRQEEKTEKRQEGNSCGGGHPVFLLAGAALVGALSLTGGAEWPMEDRRPLISA